MKIVTTRDTQTIIERTLAKNEYADELIYEAEMASVILLINLIKMPQGTIPDLPNMYFDVDSKKHVLLNGTNVELIRRSLENLISIYLSGHEITLSSLTYDKDSLHYEFVVNKLNVNISESIVKGEVQMTDFDISEKNFDA